MIRRKVVDLLPIFVSIIIAFCIGVVVWKILALIFPHKSVLELSLGAIEPDYDLPRWAVGSIVFGLLYIFLCYLQDISLARQALRNIDVAFTFKLFWIAVLSLRIVFSLYLVSFWSNYIFYRWFSSISLAIGGFGNDFFVRQGCVIVPSLLGIYIIVIEPWKKLISMTPSRFLGTGGRISSIIFISINFYLLSVIGFFSHIIIPILIDLIFLTLLVIMINMKGHAINNRANDT